MNFIIEFYDWFANGPLMNDLLAEEIGLFGVLFTTMFGITLLGVVLYYYAMNGRHRRSSSLASPGYWFMILGICALLVFVAHYVTCNQMADQMIPRNPGAPPKSITYFFDQNKGIFAGFAGQVAGLSIALFVGLSLLLKWGSGQAKRSPF